MIENQIKIKKGFILKLFTIERNFVTNAKKKLVEQRGNNSKVDIQTMKEFNHHLRWRHCR